MARGTAHSPMFRQYHALKEQHSNSILFFRMGDFYEMFYDDAKTASRILELTLTARGKGTDNVVPMCGFPHHQLDSYAARLVRANQRVAICDQVEDPKATKGLVKREVVRTVTPGTLNDPSALDATDQVWLSAVVASAGRLGAAFLDVSTGAFWAWESEASAGDPYEQLFERLREFRPRELVCADDFAGLERARETFGHELLLTETESYSFSQEFAQQRLQEQLKVESLDGFGLRDKPVAIRAAGGLLSYLQETQRCGWEHIDRIALFEPTRYLRVDASTRRNLELFRSLRDGSTHGTLTQTLDRTRTPSGARLFRDWIHRPLLDIESIRARQDAVEEWLKAPRERDQLRDCLRGVSDIERLVSRTVAGSANPRDLVSLRESLSHVPEIVQPLAGLGSRWLREILDRIDPCRDLQEMLAQALVDDPPVSLREGGVIREGWTSDLDELRVIQRDGKQYIANLEATEKESTGISSLKVRFNKVFGYFIEVSKANLHLVPEHYHRKQTIANGERYITPQLKDYESKVLNAQERIEAIEVDVFQQLRSTIAAHAPRLKAVAEALARLDVSAALGELAHELDFSRPELVDESVLEIKGGRHPVVEASLVQKRFVPNDTHLARDAASLAILTGPNMGGKSTYLRQVALIVLLAQTGSFVPCEAARLGVADRIFCRVGASDNLAEGQSTFMVEMTETANILHHASANSLVILDEIGRGTSTFDGLSIAWAVVESLHGKPGGSPRTLFATHYHELTELAIELDGVTNLRMAVREHGDQVRFMHRVETGASDRSYGIQVARLAGVPKEVVQRAKQILANLERDAFGNDGRPRRGRGTVPARSKSQPMLSGLFEAPEELDAALAPSIDPAAAEVLAELRESHPDRMTPLEALTRLSDWAQRLHEKSDPE